MKLAIFDGGRLGVVDGAALVDVSAAVPGWDAGYAANWWLRLCESWPSLRPELERAAAAGPTSPVTEAALEPAVLHPGKIVAAAANYADHVSEMTGRAGVEGWQLDFDIFLKAPSSVIGPGARLRLPAVEGEVHHECELAVVIGREGYAIPEQAAMDHVLGYTIALDMTLRGSGDRSRRKSYDGFTPIGPWLVLADEIADPHGLRIQLEVNGRVQQDVETSAMQRRVPAIIAHISSIMTLHPGDVICTGAPAGVGRVRPGDHLRARISGIGEMELWIA